MGDPKLTELEARVYKLLQLSPISGGDVRSWEVAALNRLVKKGLAVEQPTIHGHHRRWILAPLPLSKRHAEIEKKLGNVEYYSPTMPLHWQEYHDIIRSLLKEISSRKSG